MPDYRKFVKTLTSGFANFPEAIQVTYENNHFGIRCRAEDQGKIIGKQGANRNTVRDFINHRLNMDSRPQAWITVLTTDKMCDPIPSWQDSLWSDKEQADLTMYLTEVVEIITRDIPEVICRDQGNTTAVTIQTTKRLPDNIDLGLAKFVKAVGRVRGRVLVLYLNAQDHPERGAD